MSIFQNYESMYFSAKFFFKKAIEEEKAEIDQEK